jgi:alginate O-acetyltransferase complex protein AlgJ
MLRKLFSLAILAVVTGVLILAYAPAFLRPPSDVVVGSQGWLYPGWERLVDERKSAARQGVRLVVAVDTALKVQGQQLIVVVTPTKARVVSEHLPRLRQFEVSRAQDYDALIRSLESSGVRVVDTLPLLKRRHLRDGRAYFRRDAHWTGYAAEDVAQVVASRIRAETPLPVEPPDGERLGGWEQVRRYPDLVAILRRQGDLSLGEERFTQREYKPEPRGPGRVTVVGSSFVDRRYGLPQTLSQLLDRRVSRRVEFGAEGSWAAMVGHLRGRDPVTRVVIWQLGEGSFSSDQAQASMKAYLKEKGSQP